MSRHLLLFIVALIALPGLRAQTLSQKDFYEDFETLWQTAKEQYAYWPEKKTDWDCVHEHYRKALDTVHTKRQFTTFLEAVLRELYDNHIGLNTNTSSSYRLVPTGADLALRLQGDRVWITEVRPRSGAAAAGIRAGMELTAIDGKAPAEALKALLPLCLRAPDSAARLFALQQLAAGTHDRPRRFTLRSTAGTTDYFPDTFVNIDTLRYEGLLESRMLPGGIGYIGIHNSLGDEDLIPAFDSALNGLAGARGLIIDLRETPSGGTSTVARALMGRLLRREGYYQRHELPADSGRYGVRRSWVEIVTPRGRPYDGPVAVLAGAWTGSMGEGIVVGLHGLGRAKVFGHPMAGLNGAIYPFRLPHSGIGYNLSAERLYHVNGTRRELFRALQEVRDGAAGTDAALEAAIRWLRAKAR
ncbi:MAG: peptidase [Chitinophagaceae bacterium]|nr:MAG: peptidase [Chitinophagaceae bacterium]